MVERLSRLLLFNREYKDRIVIVDPLDAPALNLFQTTGRDPAQLISDFGYIFSTTNQKLTGKQNSVFFILCPTSLYASTCQSFYLARLARR